MKYGIVTERLISIKDRDFLAEISMFVTVDNKADSLDIVLNQIVNSIKASSFEDFSEALINKAHNYVKNAKEIEVSISADISLKRRTPTTNRELEEMYKIISKAVFKDGKIKKMIGAEVVGITSCPCAQEGLIEYSRAKLREKFSESEIDYIIANIPIASHNQRNITRVLIEVHEGADINVVDLIDTIEGSMSSRIYEVLKRSDEVDVVLEAHLRPRFVEDVVRNVLIKIIEKYKNLPDNSLVIVRSESFESIHKHNAIAERVATIGEIKEELKIKL